MKQYELIEDIYRSLARIESLIDTGAVRLRTESGQTAVTERKSFFSYMKIAALELRRSGNLRTSETYTAAMNSFRKFLKGRDIMVDEIDSSIISSYESWLKDRGVCPNSTSFYMRNLRAAYNKAAAGGLTPQRQPFRNVYTGVDRTHKRAIPLETIDQGTGHRRKEAVSQCGRQRQPQPEVDRQKTRAGHSSHDVRGQALVGERGPQPEHSPSGNKRGHGARLRPHHAHLSGVAGQYGNRRGEQNDNRIAVGRKGETPRISLPEENFSDVKLRQLKE